MHKQPVDKSKLSTILAFDFGLRKIGVAVGQMATRQAAPINLLKANDGIPDWKEIDGLIEQWLPDCIVVGLPYRTDGGDQLMTHCARKFANRLQHRTQLPVYLEDERLTTQLAKDRQEIKSHAVDAVAAKIILEAWMES